MLILLIFLTSVFLSLIVMVLAGVSDFKTFTIPNFYSAALLALFVLSFSAVYLFAPQLEIFYTLKAHILGFAILLGITLLLYALKLLGAGDSKFMAALGLWIGTSGLVPFLFYMSLAGGVLAAFTLFLRKRASPLRAAEGSWLDVAQKGDSRLPYGIAIAFGGVLTFIQNGYLSPETWAQFVQ